jgi:hypothetical protein
MPSAPGKSFVQMFDLIYSNNFARPTFSDRLLIAIFWEETLFNNIFQIGGGTGVGFGQVEPAEFYKLKKYGVSLPPVRKEGWKTYSTRPLKDDESVKASAALLSHLHSALGSVQSALEGYAGVQWARDNPSIAKPTANERLTIIGGWKACALKLEPCRPFREPTRAEENDILDALQMARGFAARREEFRSLLFREEDYED